MSADPVRLSSSQAERFAQALLMAHGVNEKQAMTVAKNIVWSEFVGRQNFGFERFPTYIQRLKRGGINPDCQPKLELRGNNIAMLDGDNGFGQFTAKQGMDTAVDLAHQHGVGLVGVRNSNFFGTGACFVQQAANSEMIGLAMSNSFPKVVAHGGLSAVFGTNPFAFGAPRKNGQSLLVDFATSALAGSSVRQAKRLKKPLPEGLAIDKQGHPITHPDYVKDGALLPFAGAKGTGMALMVEILAGILSGAQISTGVKSMYGDLQTGGGNGHFLIAINIRNFMPLADYFQRLETLLALIRQSGEHEDAVLFPGEIRWKNFRANHTAGLLLDPALRTTLTSLAKDIGVTPPWRQVDGLERATP